MQKEDNRNSSLHDSVLPLSGCKKNVGTLEDNAASPEEENEEETETYTFGYTCTTMSDNPYFVVLEESIREEVEKQGGRVIARPEAEMTSFSWSRSMR